MLDVHPPHHSPNTWRDFLLHIATIVVGLLIAIGLEQSVEAIHHHHQRVQLEEDLRTEAELNVRIIDNDLHQAIPGQAWYASVIATARDTQPVNGVVTFVIPALPESLRHSSGDEYSTAPSRGVWPVAQATGTVDLLPKHEAEVYNRLDFEASEATRIGGLNDVEVLSFGGVLRALNIDLSPGLTVRLTQAQRDEFVRATAQFLELNHWYRVRLAFWAGASEAVLHNVTSVQQVIAYTEKPRLRSPNPDHLSTLNPETPMLDVHPPHHSPNTFRDFLLHIATIVVGLLIAIGLEQTVEAIHHHHQREELREALLQDNQKALRDNQDVERSALNRVQWLTARVDDGVTALRSHTYPHTISLVPISIRSVPVDPNWKAARSSNLVEVLPQQDVKAFAEVDDLIDELKKRLNTSEYISRRIAFEQRFRASPSNDTLDLSAATRDDLTQYLALLSEERSNAISTYEYTLYVRGCLTAVIRGERNLDRIDDEEDSVEEEGLKHLYDNDPYRTADPTPTLRTH